MSRQTWQETLAYLSTDGTPVTNTTPLSIFGTSVAAAQAKYTLPANFLQVGSMLRVSAKGRISNIVTTPGTLTMDIRFGSVVVFNGGTMALNVVAKTNVTWIMDVVMTCRSIGSGTTATMFGIGQFQSESIVGAAAGTTVAASIPASAPAAGTGFDSTAAQQVDVFATWSINNAGNTLTCHEYSLEALN